MRHRTSNTAAYIFQVWASFIIAAAVTGVGILCLPVTVWHKAFLGMGLLFTIGSSFTLAKTVRDEFEAGRAAPVAEVREGPFRRAA